MADNPVQLGFALPLHNNNSPDDGSNASECNPELGHQSPHWSEWDGGKIGGCPSWLNPRDLPEATPLRCRGPCCSIEHGKQGTTLRFITQLYCPADDVTENESAFHRSLYVFACPTCCSAPTPIQENDGSSITPSATHHLSQCIRVLRCQLPKHNDFYPTTGDGESNDDDDEWTKHTSHHWAKSTNNDKLNLCAVCGHGSSGKCPKQKLWFCGPDHQKECLRASKQQQENEDDDSNDDVLIPIKYLQSVCYESELVVEEEPTATTDDNDTTLDNNDIATTKYENALFPSKDITDADADLEQSDLNALTGNVSLAQAATGVTDPTTLAFYARMAIGGTENDVRNQCLRYCRWPEPSEATTTTQADEEEEVEEVPLWLSSNDRPPSQSATSEKTDSTIPPFPPPCQYCGAPRAFEFQILPQMLHHLLQSPENADTTTAANNGSDESNEKSSRQVLTDSEMAILMEAKSKIESGMDLPEGFLEQHEAALANAREALLGVSNNNNGKGGSDEGGSKGGLDWGTIAVYTCTASCGDGGVVSGENGAYREEAAWMQPPLD